MSDDLKKKQLGIWIKHVQIKRDPPVSPVGEGNAAFVWAAASFVWNSDHCWISRPVLNTHLTLPPQTYHGSKQPGSPSGYSLFGLAKCTFGPETTRNRLLCRVGHLECQTFRILGWMPHWMPTWPYWPLYTRFVHSCDEVQAKNSSCSQSAAWLRQQLQSLGLIEVEQDSSRAALCQVDPADLEYHVFTYQRQAV